MKKFALKLTVAAVALIGLQTSSYAVDSVSVEAGAGSKVQMLRLGAQWDWKNTAWWQSNGTHIGGYWDLTVAEWHEKRYNNTDSSKNFTDIGFTPVFRFQRDDRKASTAKPASAFTCSPRCITMTPRSFRLRSSSATTSAPAMCLQTASTSA